MQNVFPIADSELENIAIEAVGNVFSTMLDTEASLVLSTEVTKQEYGNGFKLPLDTDQTLIAGTDKIGLSGVL